MICEALIAAAVGGLLWLDRFQVFQIMISRPIVCAPIVGWAVGDLQTGLASGILFELLWLRRPPVGGYIPPDGTLASIATAAVSSIIRADTGATLTSVVFLSFLFIYPVAFFARTIDGWLRTRLGSLAAGAERAQAQDGERSLYLYIGLALLLGFCSAFFFLLSTILLATLLLSQLTAHISPVTMRVLGFGFYVVPLVGTADLLVGLSERRYAVLFVIGFAAAIGLGLILGIYSSCQK